MLPGENQTKYWKQQDVDVYNDIKLRADKVKVLAPHYYNGCMQKRNRHLVDCNSACICFLIKHEGGTAYTVDYAKQKGLYLMNVPTNAVKLNKRITYLTSLYGGKYAP